jgi:hypothetical protein
MAFGDNAMDYTDCDTTIVKLYRLHPATAQFTQHGATSKWFRPNVVPFEGNRWNFNAWHTPYSGVRQSDYATAATSAFPVSRDLASIWLSYAYTDLSMFQGVVKWNILTAKRTKSRKAAVYAIASKMFNGLNRDMTEKTNSAIHMNSACQMALIHTVYSEAGGAYSSNRYAYLRIKSGGIGQFEKGMVIKTDNTEELTVLDVIYGSNGPWSGGTQVSSIGPGIRVDAGSGNTVDSSADDAITRSGETTGDNFHGFPDWFNGGTNVYNDEDGNAIDRDLRGNAWSIPQIFTIAASGSEVALDLDTHLRRVANTMPYRVSVARRRNREQGLSVGNAMVAITTPELVNQATTEAAASQQWTSAALGSMDAAKRKALFGQVGFEGMVFHSATLGPIAFQEDVMAAPYKIRMLEPSTWFWLAQGASPQSDAVEWIMGGINGGRIHPVPSDDGDARLTFYQQAGGYKSMMLVCDQPGPNIELTGVDDDV